MGRKSKVKHEQSILREESVMDVLRLNSKRHKKQNNLKDFFVEAKSILKDDFVEFERFIDPFLRTKGFREHRGLFIKMFNHRKFFIRDSISLVSKTKNAQRQIRAIIRHLFVKY